VLVIDELAFFAPRRLSHYGDVIKVFVVIGVAQSETQILIEEEARNFA
jgi:hypothetical protein